MRGYIFTAGLLVTGVIAASQPVALVYRGPSACEGCPEAIEHLLKSSPLKFKVIYAGPNETVQVNRESLSSVDVYAQGGGPDLDSAYEELKPTKNDIRRFVSEGGRYLGFCLGAYLAGNSPGFNLLPHGADASSEILRPKSQVKDDKDTLIQVDWRFSSGSKTGETETARWLYFQEGAVMTGIDPSSDNVLARYTANGDIAATVTPFGNGWVGLVGPHPEATHGWYADVNFTNPEGIKWDIGYDLVEATMNGINVDE